MAETHGAVIGNQDYYGVGRAPSAAPNEPSLPAMVSGHNDDLAKIVDALDRVLINLRGPRPQEVPEASPSAGPASLFSMMLISGRYTQQIAQRVAEILSRIGG